MPAQQPPEYFANEQAPHMAATYVYVIQHDDGTRVYYSGFDREITLVNLPADICPEGEALFLPSQIKHGAVTNNDKFEERATVLTIDSNDQRFRRFCVTAAAVKLRCWIIRLSAGDEIPDEVNYLTSCFVVESGILSKFAFSGMTIAAEVVPEPYFVNFSVPRVWCQKQCNHALYGEGCYLNKDGFAFTTTIVSVDPAARTIIISGRKSGAPADWFEAGMFRHPESGLNYAIAWSAFEDVSDTLLKLGYWNPELAPGQALTAYAGCRRTTADCLNKFNNAANFGGFAFVPGRNPVTNFAV